MSWYEVIHVRLNNREYKRPISIFTQLLKEIRVKESCHQVRLFRRAQVDSDICLHLLHETNNVEVTGSVVGTRIAEALRAFGMVNHTVWKPVDQD